VQKKRSSLPKCVCGLGSAELFPVVIGRTGEWWCTAAPRCCPASSVHHACLFEHGAVSSSPHEQVAIVRLRNKCVCHQQQLCLCSEVRRWLMSRGCVKEGTPQRSHQCPIPCTPSILQAVGV
jgi:hypothetical protein